MPTYEYSCKACGHSFEREQRITEEPIKKCPKCKAMKASRMISNVSFVLKGGGWYADLYHEYNVAPTLKEARSAFGPGQYAFYDGMRKGQVGMWFGGLSERGGMAWRAEWFVNWGMAPLAVA